MRDVINQIKQAILYSEIREDNHSLSLTIDRYRRHDHGGGSDGDDWLEDHKIEDDMQKGIKAHTSKLNKVKEILRENGYLENAEFELGEKGHFSIEIYFKK